MRVIQIYPTCSLRVVRVSGGFFSGRIFFISINIYRALSKFCRLIVSIVFRSATPSIIKKPLTTAHRGQPLRGRARMATVSVVTGEALSLPNASSTVTSSSATIFFILCCCSLRVGSLVTCPLSAQPCLWCDGECSPVACSSIHWTCALQSSITR